jgi:hypothetical protein
VIIGVFEIRSFKKFEAVCPKQRRQQLLELRQCHDSQTGKLVRSRGLTATAADLDEAPLGRENDQTSGRIRTSGDSENRGFRRRPERNSLAAVSC